MDKDSVMEDQFEYNCNTNNPNMPDISKCMGGNCPLKKSCYRFTSKACQWQSYLNIPPFQGDKCDMYMPNRESEEHEH
jgi:hypothetical protein